MTLRSGSLFALILFGSILVTAPRAGAAPEPGRYVGFVRITKTLPPYYRDALSVSTVHRVVAKVVKSDAGLKITLLTEVGEPPMKAFNADDSVIHAIVKADASCVVKGPPFGAADGPSDYQGILKETRDGFTLRHDNIPMGVNFLVDPHLTQATTDFSYVLREVTPSVSQPAASAE